MRTLYLASGLTAGLVALILVVRICRGASDEERPAGGMRQIELALYGQVVATFALVASSVLLDAPLVGLLAVALELGCLVVFALGALDAAGALVRWLAVASATAALCIAGTTRGIFMWLVLRDFEPPRAGSPRLFTGPQPTFTLPISAQLVIACAIGALLVALAIAARRRELEALRARLFARTGAFVALSLGAITAQDMLGKPSELTPLDVMTVVAANAALISSWIIAARAVRAAARELGGTTLPAATLVKR